MKKNIHLSLLLCCSLGSLTTQAQTNQVPDTSIKDLDEIIISFNKWEQKSEEIPNKIAKIDMRDVRLRNPQTSADMLAQSGAVFVQKSQLGGGSPMIRGFATNRVLIVADGVRMNNAIYRSGNIQNIISIDPLTTESAEVIFGPGSNIYGSDAIGGVMDFHSLSARFSSDTKTFVSGNALARYATANQEKTVHADLNVGRERWAFLGSVSYSDFGDLKMGRNGGQDSYLRPEYVERVGLTDSIVSNIDPRIQKFSGYNQLNILAKLRYRLSDQMDLQYSYTYANTGDAPRYDRLIQYRQGKLRFAEWYYGPMIWRMHTLKWNHNRKTALYEESRFIAAYQDYDESRNDRTRGNNKRRTQAENVRAYSFNFDARKTLGGGDAYYGLEYVFNKVGSSGYTTQIVSGERSPFASRYPDGSTWSTFGIYASYKKNLSEQLTILAGLRYSRGKLRSEFDTSFVPFPYASARIDDGALTGNLGLVFRPLEGWQFNANMATGFRMPNVDDVGKLFESAPGAVTVPNPELSSEYAWNFELGLVRSISNKLKLEINGFHTILNNAITRRPYTFNGQDSIDFDGVFSQVLAMQNVARATVWGLQAGLDLSFSTALSLQTYANWISGKETDDAEDIQVPLRHAPPFYGNTNLRYKHRSFFFELTVFYNSTIRNEDLAPTEKAKTDIYARDENGNPYSPGWYALNAKASWQLTRNFTLYAGCENITNRRYRPYSSGIVASGTNFISSLRISF